jgi:ketosteroid isomerase-like protein
MGSTSFDTFFVQRTQAAQAYVTGDGAPLDALVPHEGDATFFSPLGDTVSGADSVARRYLGDAEAFQEGGTTRFEVLQKGQSGDLAFWTGYQTATVRIGAVPDRQDMRMRVTEIYRRVDGVWRLIHRHADNQTVAVRRNTA